MTIEERAKGYSEFVYDEYQRINARDAAYGGYVAGATEQQQIDIDKACEWLADILEDVPERDWAEDKVAELRKAMEE